MIFISTLACKQIATVNTNTNQHRVGINIAKKEIYSTKNMRKITPKTR